MTKISNNSFNEFVYSIQNLSKNGTNTYTSAKNAFDLGGREFVSFIQYGYLLEVDIEIEGLETNHIYFFKVIIKKCQLHMKRD